MRTTERLPGRLAGAAVLTTFCALGAHAQSADPTEGGQEAKRQLLEEIVVTADRRNSFGADYVQAGTFRNARVIDTPLTVTVMTRDLLDSQQAVSLGDAVKNTAGVTFSQVSPAVYSNLAIRGIAVENRSNYRMNGSLPIVNLIDLPLEDKERVEVLKGVASLYYGFTTPAGIVNMTMKRPGDPVAAVTLTGNQYGATNGHVDVGRRFLDDKIGLRVNAVYGDLETGVERIDGYRGVGAMAFDWDPTDSVDVRIDAEYIRKKITETATITLPAAVNGVTTLPPLQDAKNNLASEWMYSDADELNLLGHVEWRFADNWSVTAQAGRSRLVRDRHYNTFRNYNLATGEGTLQVLLSNGNEYVNENYHVELAGGFETGPLVHQLSIGGNQNTRTALVPSNPSVNYAQNYYNPRVVAETPLPARVIPNPSQITDIGAYVFDRISYQEWLDVLVGLRYTDYENSSRTTLYRTNDVSPSYGVVFKPRTWLSFYATYIEGLEEGGTAPLIAVNGGEVLPPATSEQKEIGVKAELGRSLVTLAYFDIDRPSSFLRSDNRFVQDGRTTYRGWEASTSGELTERWSISASAMLLDAEQEKAATANVIGKQPENTPEFTGSLFVEYRPAFLEGLGLSAGVFHAGKRAVNNANTAFVDGYTTFDVGARYSTDFGAVPVTLRLKIDNVADENYWAATGSNLLSQSLPRTAKFAVDVRF